MVTSNASLFAFGDAQYYGAIELAPIHSPIVGFAPTFDGGGYWVVSANGEVFGFGDYGVPGPDPQPYDLHGHQAVGIATNPTTDGYWLVDDGGNVYAAGTSRTYEHTGG
jgi:hypothetical protein